jgi:hypothetical protein
MLDWLAKMLKLPDFYLSSSGGLGGGIIQSTASDATLVALLGARSKMIKEVKDNNPSLDEYFIQSKLVAYCSEQVSIFFRNISIVFFVNKIIFEGSFKRRTGNFTWISESKKTSNRRTLQSTR